MPEEKMITFSELCSLSGRKVLSLSRCTQTKACGCPNFRCKVASASLYITPLKLKSAIAFFALPVTSVFKYINFVSAVRTAESTVDLN